MRTRKLVKNLVGLERKLDEIDKLLSESRAAVNEMFWDMKVSVEKRKK
ncbi:MAG: hypothetical protein AAB662_04235 [Patescibacteria group bacterium]